MSEPIALNLKKAFEINLKKANIEVPILAARAAIDKSGSMGDLYRNGWVDKTIDLFIGAALKFDDNGELEIGFFNQEMTMAPNAVAEDAGQYLRTKGAKHHADGGTAFSPVIEEFEEMQHPSTGTEGLIGNIAKSVFGGLFGKKKEEPRIRAYAGIITDGANNDHDDVEILLRQSNGETFYQFIGIGNQVDTAYLKSLQDRFPFVGFVHLEKPTEVTPDQFYEKLCNPKFADWIKQGEGQ
jgi:hypothetical protein